MTFVEYLSFWKLCSVQFHENMGIAPAVLNFFMSQSLVKQRQNIENKIQLKQTLYCVKMYTLSFSSFFISSFTFFICSLLVFYDKLLSLSMQRSSLHFIYILYLYSSLTEEMCHRVAVVDSSSMNGYQRHSLLMVCLLWSHPTVVCKVNNFSI